MENTIEKSIIINNKKLSGLRVILHQWIDNINKYYEKFGNIFDKETRGKKKKRKR